MEKKKSDTIITLIIVYIILFPLWFILIPITVVYLGVVGFALWWAKRLKDDAVEVNIDDFKLDKQYYRDILKEYSIGEIVYIDRFYTEIEDIVVLTLLKLIHKKKIELTQSGFVIHDREMFDLKPSEAIILESIDEDGIVRVSGKLLKEKVKQEIEHDELVERTKIYRKMRWKDTIAFSVVMIIISKVLLELSVIYSEYSGLQTMLQMSSIMLIGIGIPLFTIVYNSSSSSRYIRTEKGNELNRKIEGLKKYINDYSLVNERTSEDMALWEDYIIYSVLARTNKTDTYENILCYTEIRNKNGIIETLLDVFI